MLYKFKSKVTGDLIMLEPNGRQVLQLIGKGDAASLTKGILLPADMASAIAALEHAVADDEAAQQKRVQEAQAAGDKPAPRAETVSLRQRAVPFIDMLKRCLQADKEIVWGV
jgi:cyclopropane-fatty-acyl-phospholipid synthase